jgi:FtsP/CotA-like multicopper oxidase with cupredoxin domain
MHSKKKLIYSILLVAAAASSSVLLIISFAGDFSGGNRTSTLSSTSGASSISGCSRPPGYVLIIANESGFNGSARYSTSYLAAHPWPVISVKKGQTVNIIVCNTDPTFSHGFGITHYLDSGIAVQPGSTFKFTFVADEVGDFTIRCTIFCPPHIFMQYGRITVSS